MGILLVILLLSPSIISGTAGVECFESSEEDCLLITPSVCTASTCCYMRIVVEANPHNITDYQSSYSYGCISFSEEEGNVSAVLASLCSDPASWIGGRLYSYTCCTSHHCNENIEPRHDIESLLLNKYSDDSNDQESSSILISPSLPLLSSAPLSLYSLPTMSTSTTIINNPTIGPLIISFSEVTNNRPHQTIDLNFLLPVTVIPAAAFIVLFLFIIFLCYQCNRRKTVPRNEGNASVKPAEDIEREQEILSSGSGMGEIKLMNRTIAKDVELHEVLGQGTYGSISRCTYLGNTYAVKRFSTINESSFRRELWIYNINLRQENVLPYVTADMITIDNVMECWLILHYCPKGSLYAHLMSASPSLETAARIVYSACMGLSYLHLPFRGYGTLAKPRIAHRDIKTKNLLMKNEETCCIADFGLSIAETEDYASFVSLDQGTNRYMPPEILSKTIDVRNFLSFINGDNYSFGLVLWEVLNRAKIEEGAAANEHVQANAYQIPYQNELPTHSSIEDARRVVVEEGKRPVTAGWPNNKFLKGLACTIKELLSNQSNARPPMELVRKKMERLAKDASITLRH